MGSTTPIRLAGILLTAGLLLTGACTADTSPVESTQPPPPATTTTALDETVGVAYEVLELATHPNGSQLRIDRIEVLSGSTVVIGHIINGSPFEIRLGRGTTELRTVEGGVVGLLDPIQINLQPAEETALTLRFDELDETEAIVLALNHGGGSSPSDPSTSSPSFELGPIPLDESSTRPALPDPVPVARAVADPAGIELRVEGINFTETRIGVLVRLSNPSSSEARIAPSIAPSVVVDDLGNRYPVVLPEGENHVSVPATSAVNGTLIFAGRIHPSATSLSVGVNAGSGSLTDRDLIFPELVVRDIPLTGDVGLAPLPDPLTVSEVIDHPAGVSMELGRVGFTDTGMEVSVVLVNERPDSVALAAGEVFARDDLASPYPLVPLRENPDLVVEPNTTIEATLAFSGRIADQARSVSLTFNAGRSTSDPDTRQPSFEFGPYELQRPDEPVEPIVAEVFLVGPQTRLVPADLIVSQVDQITQTLEEFDATEVEGGFRLTLPDSILFDFGSAELRTDASQALTLIAEVLEFYGDASIIIVGHTDSIGSDSSNQRLSEERAQGVMEALITQHGISADRLEAEGRGEAEPVAPNTNADGSDNPEGRQLNRRVEIVVLTDEPVELP